MFSPAVPINLHFFLKRHFPSFLTLQIHQLILHFSCLQVWISPSYTAGFWNQQGHSLQITPFFILTRFVLRMLYIVKPHALPGFPAPYKWQISEMSALVCTKSPKAGVGSQLVQEVEMWSCFLLPPVVLGDPCGNRPRSAHAWRDCLQWTHCRSQHHQKNWWCLWENMLKKGQEILGRQRRRREKRVRNNWVQKQGWRRRCSRCHNRYHSLVRDHPRADFLDKDCSQWKAMAEQREGVRRRE